MDEFRNETRLVADARARFIFGHAATDIFRQFSDRAIAHQGRRIIGSCPFTVGTMTRSTLGLINYGSRREVIPSKQVRSLKKCAQQ